MAAGEAFEAELVGGIEGHVPRAAPTTAAADFIELRRVICIVLKLRRDQRSRLYEKLVTNVSCTTTSSGMERRNLAGLTLAGDPAGLASRFCKNSCNLWALLCITPYVKIEHFP